MNKYQEIIDSIKKEINVGKLKASSKLPSIREAADIFECSKATAIRAYAELEKDHVIYTKPKSGYYVVDSDKPRTQNYKALGSETIDFTSASPDLEVLPYRDFQHCLNQSIELYKELLFSYSDPQGLLSTRKVLAEHLKDYQIFTSPENIFITSGSQQILSILAAMPFPNGKNAVLVEQPVYNGITKALELSNVTTIGIERNHDGFDLVQLERIFRSGSIKFFYTIPRFHNPTGASHSMEHKKQILRLAQKYDVYILEDDYLADLELSTKNDPIFSFDTEARTIYAKSFSKVLLPGLRLGIAVIPRLLANKFREYKKAADISTTILSQGALEIYIKSGMFNAHVHKIRGFYHNRMKHLSTIIDAASLEGIRYAIPKTGFFTSLEFPEGFKVEKLVQRLADRNVAILDARVLFMDSFVKENVARLSICRVDEAKITQGITAICEEYKWLLNRSITGPTYNAVSENKLYI